jgi:hypothetical protein
LVNELYFRYIFAKRFKTLYFDEHCRIKVLGDDHILCLSESLDWNPVMIGEDMKQVGQVYTSAFKIKS